MSVEIEVSWFYEERVEGVWISAFAGHKFNRAQATEKIEQRKQELLAGGMNLEEAQEVLLTEASAYSVAARDFSLAMKVSSEISKTTGSKLDARKIALLEKKASAYDQLKSAVNSGGVTPETLTKIERELKLL